MYSIHTLFAEAFAVVWIFVLGSAIGSFLNVVVYRLPNKKTLLGSSFCPRCRQEILFRDNIPIFGWIFLKGKCRVCLLPISSRYPIVELTCGAMLLVIAIPELALGGINMPGVELPRYAGFSWNLMDLPANLIVMYAGHAFLACVLLTAALIEWDHEWIPQSLTITLLALAFTFTFLNPALPNIHSPKIALVGSSLNSEDFLQRLLGVFLGGFTGSIVGWSDTVPAVARSRRGLRSSGGQSLDGGWVDFRCFQFSSLRRSSQHFWPSWMRTNPGWQELHRALWDFCSCQQLSSWHFGICLLCCLAGHGQSRDFRKRGHG